VPRAASGCRDPGGQHLGGDERLTRCSGAGSSPASARRGAAAASRMATQPVQRQRLPSRASRASAGGEPLAGEAEAGERGRCRACRSRTARRRARR
jgi:hypothetical protein